MHTHTGLITHPPTGNDLSVAVVVPDHIAARARQDADAGIPLHKSRDPEVRAWARAAMKRTHVIDFRESKPPVLPNPDAQPVRQEPRVFRSKEDKKRIARFRRLQKARGNR